MGRGGGGGLLRDQLVNRKTIIGRRVEVIKYYVMVYIDVCTVTQPSAGR